MNLPSHDSALFSFRILRPLVLSCVAVAGAGALRAQDAPDTFLWSGGTNDWDAAGAWMPTATSRVAPGIAGDTISIQANASTVQMVSGTKTISEIAVEAGGFVADGSRVQTGIVLEALGTPESPTVLELVPREGESAVRIGGASKMFRLGSYDLPCENMVLRLGAPLVFDMTGTGNWGRWFIAPKLTGGSSEAPVDLSFRTRSDAWNMSVFLTNPGNDFVGDIHLGSDTETCNPWVFLGYANVSGDNGQLGAASNRLYFHRNGVLRVQPGGSVPLSRVASGSGEICATYCDTGWNLSNPSGPLVLGSGMVLDPCTLATGSPYGKFTLRSTSTQMDNASEFIVDLGADDACDTFAFVEHNTALVFNGKVTLRDLDDADPGTVWPLFTVNAGAKKFTFSPSSSTAGFYLHASGSDAAGWTVQAVKLNDAATTPSVVTTGTSDVQATSAVVTAEVPSLGGAESVTLRVYIKEGEDAGATSEGWDRFIDQTVTAAGTVTTEVTGLTLDVGYSFRHSVLVGGNEYFSPLSGSFTTQDLSEPTVYKSTGTITSGSWFNPELWSHDTQNPRQVPRYPGDTAEFYTKAAPTDRSYTVDRDLAIRTFTICEGNNSGTAYIDAEEGTAPVFNFDSGDDDAACEINFSGQFRDLMFGNSSADSLTLNFHQTLKIAVRSAYNHVLRFYCPVTGGSEEFPADIDIDTFADRWSSISVQFIHTNNTFRGDLFVGAPTVHSRDKWNNPTEASATLVAGDENHLWDDTMFGDPANAIQLRYKASLILYSPKSETAAAPALKRHVYGEGTVTTRHRQDQWNTKDGERNLTLGEGCVLDPNAAVNLSACGQITVKASTLFTEPGAKYVFDAKADHTANDSVRVQLKSATSLDLCGSVVLRTDEKVVNGEEWAVFEIPATDKLADVESHLTTDFESPYRLGFDVRGDAETGWTVYAVVLPPQTLILVK